MGRWYCLQYHVRFSDSNPGIYNCVHMLPVSYYSAQWTFPYPIILIMGDLCYGKKMYYVWHKDCEIYHPTSNLCPFSLTLLKRMVFENHAATMRLMNVYQWWYYFKFINNLRKWRKKGWSQDLIIILAHNALFNCFCGSVIFHHIYVLYLPYPPLYWWTFRVLLCLGYCK